MNEQVERVADVIMNKICRSDQAETQAPAVTPPPPKEQKAPEPEGPKLSEQVLRTQKLVQAIDQRIQDRARLVSQKLRRGVEIENELRQAEKDRDSRLEAVEQVYQAEITEAEHLRGARRDVLKSAFQDLAREREREIMGRQAEINHLDLSLEQIRKQLDAELLKLDPGRKVSV